MILRSGTGHLLQSERGFYEIGRLSLGRVLPFHSIRTSERFDEKTWSITFYEHCVFSVVLEMVIFGFGDYIHHFSRPVVEDDDVSWT